MIYNRATYCSRGVVPKGGVLRIQRVVLCFSMSMLLAGSAFGQSTTGTLVGIIADPTDSAIPGARIELKNVATGAVITTQSGSEGIFRFNSLVPATYKLTIKALAGLQDLHASQYRRHRQAKSATSGKIALSIGALTEQVSVTASTSARPDRLRRKLQAHRQQPDEQHHAQGPRSVRHDGHASRRRASRSATPPARTPSAPSASTAPQFASANFTVDGITNLDTGSNGTSHFEPNMDSIAEMRVLTSNYQAEYGRNSNGVISIVTKGGSQEFHGSAWANKRHEMFNAKNFFDNYNGRQKSVYRFFVWGYSIGGPIYIPKLFNTKKQKLFFFWSQEYTKQKPGTQSRIRQHADRRACARATSPATPTATACPVALTDPTTGNPVPNNNITVARRPESRGRQGRPGDAELPCRSRISAATPASPPRAASWTRSSPARQYAAQLLLELQRDASAPQRHGRASITTSPRSSTRWVRYINDYDLDTAAPTGSFALKNSQGQFAPFAYRSPEPRPRLRRRHHLHDQPDHGQRIHLRQELQQLGLLRARPVAARPRHDGQSALVHQLRQRPEIQGRPEQGARRALAGQPELPDRHSEFQFRRRPVPQRGQLRRPVQRPVPLHQLERHLQL